MAHFMRMALAMAPGFVLGLWALLCPGVLAQGASDWTLTGLTDPSVTQLFTPSSGAFFARTSQALIRSDDGGQTWRPAIVNHPELTGVAVDPHSQFVVYATGPEGLYQSRDDAQTFQLILPFRSPFRLQAFAASAANPDLAYAAVNGQFSRTLDGGATWQPFAHLPEPNAGPCTVAVNLLQADPTDQQRLFYSAGCYAGRDFAGGFQLSLSTDQGTSRSKVLQVSARAPVGLVGGEGALPARWYIAMAPIMTGVGALYRSDDNGTTWTDVLDVQQDPANPGLPQSLSPPAYNPANPDQVYVAVAGATPGVTASTDGGLTWSQLGQQAIGKVFDLALGIDGANVYAATDQGLWVYSLSAAVR